MSKAFHTCVARFFSLILAFHFLNVNVDIPGTITDSRNAIGSTEVENLLKMVLEIDIEIYETTSYSAECEKEVKKEACADSFDLLHPHQSSLHVLHFYHSFLINLHKPFHDLQSRHQDISSPPPQRFFLG